MMTFKTWCQNYNHQYFKVKKLNPDMELEKKVEPVIPDEDEQIIEDEEPEK